MDYFYIQLIHKEKGFIIDLDMGLLLFPKHEMMNVALKIGKKVKGTLILLTQRRGTVVSKREIMNTVWAGSVVSEESVTGVLTDIRKLIRYIDSECLSLKTISGEGYVFSPELSGLSVEIKSTENTFFM